MPAAKYNDFIEFSPKGKEFIKLWNKSYRDGAIIKLAKHFNISSTTVTRIRNKLGLKLLHDPEHPGKKAFYKRIKKLYLKKGRSTTQIGNIVRMNGQNISKILKSINVKLRPQYCVNPKYFITRTGLSPIQFLKQVKYMYVEKKMTCKDIAKELKCNEGTVSTKLKCMGIEVIRRWKQKEHISIKPNFNIIAVYKNIQEPYRINIIPDCTYTTNPQSHIKKENEAICFWCANKFYRYISKGPRTQKYCSSKCKCRAKDLRRMLKDKNYSIIRMNIMISELNKTWRDNYSKAYKKIVEV